MNIFELFGTIAIKNKDANKGIDETTSKAKKLSNTFEKVGQEAAKIGKAIAKGLTVVSAAGTAAVGLLMKNSISQFAEYEQLVGGVETLFGAGGKSLEEYAESVGKSVDEASSEYDKLMASQEAVLENSKNAYKTAGLSANQYMSTATSFAASLLQGLGGDTQAAATMTDMAIQDMADNANKMGTDISMIQNAYQGFAKQNFTMLDNLKLGYGGTQAEMARLINDSGVMGETMVVTAENLNEVSFAKMIEAIHVIQKEMGITGTTAKEAEKTITGSFNAWKSAGSNLLTAIASGDAASMSEATEAFTAQTEVLLENLKPVVLNAISSIGTVLTELLPEIGADLYDFGAAIFAELLNGITGSNVTAEDVKAAVQTIIDAVVGTWNTVTTTVNNAVAAVDNFFNKTIPETYKAIVQAAADLWTETIAPAIDSAATAVANFFGIDVPDDWSLSNDIVQAWKDIITTIETAIVKIKEFLGIGDDQEKTAIYMEPIGPQTLQQQQHKTAGRYAHWTEAQQDAARGYIGAILGGHSTTDDVLLLQSLGLTDEAINNFRADISELLASGEYTVEIEDAMFEAGTQTKLQNQLNTMNLVARVKVGALTGVFAGLGGLGFNADGSHASGLRYVPHDNYLANLHLGEIVLPRNEADEYRKGSNADVVTLANRLDSALDRLSGIMQQVAANTGAERPVVLDSGAMVGQLAPRLDAQLGILTARKERRG